MLLSRAPRAEAARKARAARSKKAGMAREAAALASSRATMPRAGQPPHGTMVVLQPMGLPRQCSFRRWLAARPQP